jgi:hypothetical protein
MTVGRKKLRSVAHGKINEGDNMRRTFKLLKDLPFLAKGTEFVFYDSTGHVHWIDNGEETEYPLRTGLAGYLWLLLTEKKFFRHVDTSLDALIEALEKIRREG